MVDDISIPDNSFPESLTSTPDGTFFVGSLNLGGVVKARAGVQAEPFVAPGANASRSVLGVAADAKRNILYVCSNDMTGIGVAGPTDVKGACLKSFDLSTGQPVGSFPLSDPKSMCNDVAIGADGSAYVTDSFTPNVFRLALGANALETFVSDPALAPAASGVGLDGIAFGADGHLYVTQFIPGALFRIRIANGTAVGVTPLTPSRPLDRPDALRAFGDGFLLVEGAGNLDRVTIRGNDAVIETIQAGFAEPVSATIVGSTAWVAEGKSSFLFGANKGKDPGPFVLKPVAL
jgi:outer membrane protein assembly factor BamB